jgi:hypothetical protein
LTYFQKRGVEEKKGLREKGAAFTLEKGDPMGETICYFYRPETPVIPFTIYLYSSAKIWKILE